MTSSLPEMNLLWGRLDFYGFLDTGSFLSFAVVGWSFKCCIHPRILVIWAVGLSYHYKVAGYADAVMLENHLRIFLLANWVVMDCVCINYIHSLKYC